MSGYVIRQLLQAVGTLFGIATLLFIVVRILPGDPAIAVLGDQATPEAVAHLRALWGLDVPIWQQYIDYLAGLPRGEWGVSFFQRRPVREMVLEMLPYTLDLMAASLVVSVLIGIPLGLWTAIRRNQLPDYAGRILSLVGLSLPPFYLGVLMMLLFSLKLDWFPSMGAGDSGGLGERIVHLVLPVLTGGLGIAAYVMRLTRSSMLNVLTENYITVARAKGVSDGMLYFRHALRNALIPVLTLLGIYATVLLGNTVLIEVVFSRPGLGRLLVASVVQRDYMVLQAIAVLFAVFVALANLAVDILYTYVDPRISYD